MPSLTEPNYIPIDESSRPVTSVHVPGIGAVAAQGGSTTTDTLGVVYAPLLVYHGSLATGALITAAGTTTTQTLADQTNTNYRGIQVVLDMTTVGTGSVTLEIDNKDVASGKYYSILTGAAVITNSTNVYTVFPGATVTANVSASSVLAPTWRIKVVANNANAVTYTVGAILLA